MYEDVLTALRRHGAYTVGGGDQAEKLCLWLDGDLQVALKTREDARIKHSSGRGSARLGGDGGARALPCTQRASQNYFLNNCK